MWDVAAGSEETARGVAGVGLRPIRQLRPGLNPPRAVLCFLVALCGLSGRFRLLRRRHAAKKSEQQASPTIASTPSSTPASPWAREAEPSVVMELLSEPSADGGEKGSGGGGVGGGLSGGRAGGGMEGGAGKEGGGGQEGGLIGGAEGSGGEDGGLNGGSVGGEGGGGGRGGGDGGSVGGGVKGTPTGGKEGGHRGGWKGGVTGEGGGRRGGEGGSNGGGAGGGGDGGGGDGGGDGDGSPGGAGGGGKEGDGGWEGGDEGGDDGGGSNGSGGNGGGGDGGGGDGGGGDGGGSGGGDGGGAGDGGAVGGEGDKCDSTDWSTTGSATETTGTPSASDAAVRLACSVDSESAASCALCSDAIRKVATTSVMPGAALNALSAMARGAALSLCSRRVCVPCRRRRRTRVSSCPCVPSHAPSRLRNALSLKPATSLSTVALNATTGCHASPGVRGGGTGEGIDGAGLGLTGGLEGGDGLEGGGNGCENVPPPQLQHKLPGACAQRTHTAFERSPGFATCQFIKTPQDSAMRTRHLILPEVAIARFGEECLLGPKPVARLEANSPHGTLELYILLE